MSETCDVNIILIAQKYKKTGCIYCAAWTLKLQEQERQVRKRKSKSAESENNIENVQQIIACEAGKKTKDDWWFWQNFTMKEVED